MNGRLTCLLLILLAFATGCGGPPQVGAANLRLVDSLRTAISARRTDWLEENAKLAAERHAEGAMNDSQFAAFEAIIKQARDGNWTEAESAVMKLAKAQRGTAADANASGDAQPAR